MLWKFLWFGSLVKYSTPSLTNLALSKIQDFWQILIIWSTIQGSFDLESAWSCQMCFLTYKISRTWWLDSSISKPAFTNQKDTRTLPSLPQHQLDSAELHVVGFFIVCMDKTILFASYWRKTIYGKINTI